MPAWIELTTEDAAGKRRNTGLFSTFEQRDQAALGHSFSIYLGQISNTGPAYPTFSAAKATRRIPVPTGAKKLRIWLQAYRSNGASGTGYIRGELGPAPLLSADLAVTAPFLTWTWYELVWADVTSLRGLDANLVLKISNSVVTDGTVVRDGDTSNFIGNALGARFTWD
jgi:hypothetical protein